MTTSSRAKPQTRPARTLEHARKLCPSEDEGDRIADAFGLDQVAVGLIRASTKEALAQLAGPLADHMSETGLRVFLQRLVASFVDSACKTGEFYDAKVKVLSEEIKHHVHEEEMQKEGMFAQCRQTDVDLVALRDQMMAMKEELMAQGKQGALPPAEPRAINLMPA